MSHDAAVAQTNDRRSTPHALAFHLDWWGLRLFTLDEAYFAWQREASSATEIRALHALVEQKRLGSSVEEIAFYDATAHSNILSVLHSQRYNYYLTLGQRVVECFDEARSILDVGCGVGILTTFYARQYPEKHFFGIDRSSASILCAQEHARRLGLTNVQFACQDLETYTSPPHGYDLILATHVLLQAEQEPGIPSCSWQTFERAIKGAQQADFELRTRVGTKLDRLWALLSVEGRMILFEKTRQLARRVPLQRALAARGFSLNRLPEPVQYLLVEELVDDGPLYFLCKNQPDKYCWNECPEPDEGRPLDSALLGASPKDPELPLYENHWPSAQQIWEGLHAKRIFKEVTRGTLEGLQLHVELGEGKEGMYLYCANTYDARQVVIIEPTRKAMLESYYQEITRNGPTDTHFIAQKRQE